MVLSGLGEARVNDLKKIFAADVHGSEKCFRKFLNTPKFYKANILGGDITGKLMIPVVKNHGGTYTAKYLEAKHAAKNEQELQKILGEIRSQGFYPYVMSPEEMEMLQGDERRVEEAFKKLILEQVQSWLSSQNNTPKHRGLTIHNVWGTTTTPR